MIEELHTYKNAHKGEDIYIIGSGASMNYYDKSIFEGKTTIVLNNMYKFIAGTYCLFMNAAKDRRRFASILSECKKTYTKVVVCEGHNYKVRRWNSNHYSWIVSQVHNDTPRVREELIDTEKLINTCYVVTTGIHFAYYLGAKNIVLVGCDCSVIDGVANIAGYYDGAEGVTVNRVSLMMSHPYLVDNMIVMRDIMQRRGVNVVSMTPFIGLLNEGKNITVSDIDEKYIWAGNIIENK